MSKLQAAEKTFEFFFNRLVKGYKSIMGRDPEGLDLIKIKQEAKTKQIDANKVVEVQFGKPFGEEVNALIKSGDVNIGTANKTPAYTPSKSQTDFEIQERYRSDNDKAIKAFEERMSSEGTYSFGFKKGKEFQLNANSMGKGSLKQIIDSGELAGDDLDFAINILRDRKADGGRTGYYGGGQAMVGEDLSEIGHGADALMARNMQLSPNGQATTSTGLNYLLGQDNETVRVPYSEGKNFKEYLKDREMNDKKMYEEQLMREYLEDMRRKKVMDSKQMAAEGGRIGYNKGKAVKKVVDEGRRGFMKAAGAAGAGIAALKTGLLGFGKEAAPVVEKAAETVSNTIGQAPAYFLNLVQKIKNLGDDAPRLATKDREVVTTYKDYTLTEDLTNGEQTIQRMKVTDDGSEAYYGQPLTEETYMSYKPGQADELTKGKTPPDEYEEGTALLRSDRGNAGEIVEESATISDDVIKEGTIFEDTMSEFGKASGGRIGYNIGGLSKLGINSTSRRFLEKVFGKGSLDEMIKRDPEMHRGLLEVVEMFRNRDKEGLKMYMQKFLPHMDDTEIEEFIIGDAVDSAGQAKFGLGDMSGQLIRLGSGRDYKAKIDMIKQADNMRELDKLDVKGRKPNALGGIQTMLGE